MERNRRRVCLVVVRFRLSEGESVAEPRNESRRPSLCLVDEQGSVRVGPFTTVVVVVVVVVVVRTSCFLLFRAFYRLNGNILYYYGQSSRVHVLSFFVVAAVGLTITVDHS